MSQARYRIQNLGALGKVGESLFSTSGIPLASNLIESGWIPCGTFKNDLNEVIQAFYLPVEFDLVENDAEDPA